jgi:AbrB family looped-hinge helix DNA binding protein
MATVTTLSKGQVVIPAAIRNKYRIKPGSKLQLMDYAGIIYIIPPVENPVTAATGILPGTPSLAARLAEERKKDFR